MRILTILLLMIPSVAQAYIGPGVGAGAIGAVIAVIGAALLALFALIYYPVKRFMKSRRQGAGPTSGSDRAE